MKEKTLVILAAGMGSRFGGLKQIEPVGPNKEIIADYSIYDAIRAGFTKVVFVIKEENYDYFKTNITDKYQNKIKVEFAFQNLKDIPSGINLPENRIKMLGTAHALYVARNVVNEDFAVISADDFYGANSFKLLSEFLSNSTDYGVVGYKIGETISFNGAVKRGVCFEKDGYLDKIIESKVEKIDGSITCESLDESMKKYTVTADHPVSMLMFGLRPDIFSYMEDNMHNFFENQDDLENCEYFLPAVLDEMMQKKLIKIKVVPTNEKWMGITYADDLVIFKENINKLIEDGIYPRNLWE